MLLSFLLFWMPVLHAQIRVSGKVIDEEHNPLVGVGVLLKGTTQGTVTAEDGTFEILEVKFDMKQRSFVYKSVYKENLRVLDPEIKEIVDFIPKYGNGSNLDYGLCR